MREHGQEILCIFSKTLTEERGAGEQVKENTGFKKGSVF